MYHTSHTPWQVSNYLLVAIVLINLLIASLNNTFEEIQVLVQPRACRKALSARARVNES